jgi:hypothetical protein
VSVSVSVSELDVSLFPVEFDWLSLASLEESGFPVEEGDWQDIVQARKTKHTIETKILVFFMPSLLFLLVVIIERSLKKVNIWQTGWEAAYLIR